MAKPKLRDLSRRELTAEDYVAVVEQLETPDVPDMVAAILGATLVEHQIDQALRAQLKHQDAGVWGRLTDPTGPLRDFSSKTALGYALGCYDQNVADNLHIVKDIRNAFAHARTLLTFEHPTIKAALKKSQPVRHRRRTLSVATLAIGIEKRAYLELCFSIFMYFHLKLVESLKRRERRLDAKREELKLLNELLTSLKAAKQPPSHGANSPSARSF